MSKAMFDAISEMKISKEEKSGRLIFTIECFPIPKIEFSAEDRMSLESLKKAEDLSEFDGKFPPEIMKYVKDAIHEMNGRIFRQTKTRLTRYIQIGLSRKVNEISQEIYNWYWDLQEPKLKEWMLTFDPQRTTYFQMDNEWGEDDE